MHGGSRSRAYNLRMCSHAIQPQCMSMLAGVVHAPASRLKWATAPRLGLSRERGTK